MIIETVHGIGKRYDIEMEWLGCDKDHIRLLYSAHSKLSPGQVSTGV